MHSQLQTAPNASLQGTDGEEEWGQKENFKKSDVFKEVTGSTAIRTRGYKGYLLLPHLKVKD